MRSAAGRMPTARGRSLVMSAALNVLVHVLLLASFALFGLLMIRSIFETRNALERAIRSMALFAGALVVIGSEAADLSYSNFIIGSLGDVRPFIFTFYGFVVPAAAGIALAWYIVHAIDRSENLAYRVYAFIGMLAVTQFAVMYGSAFDDQGFEVGQHYVPNISFIVGLFVYIILKYDPEAPSRKTGSLLKLFSLMRASGDQEDRKRESFLQD